MRTLESEGRFKSQYNPVNASNLITILAATKRLKLLTNDQIKELVEEDLFSSDDEITITEVKPLPPNTPKRVGSGYRSNRSNSVPPELLDGRRSESNAMRARSARLPSINNRKQSESSDVVDGSLSRSRSRSCSRASIATDDVDEAANYPRKLTTIPVSRPVSRMDKLNGSQTARPHEQINQMVRPVTTGGYLTSRPKTARELGKPPPSSRSRSRPKTSLGLDNPGLNYSSHANIVLQENKTSRDNRGRRMSVLSSSSLGSELAKEKAAGFRRELLAVEQRHCDSVEEKRQVFLTRIKKWVEENPAIVGEDSGPKYHFIDKNENILIPSADMGATESQGMFQEQEADAWKDLTKCRYLRLTDDKMDFSGVKTLVKDQMHLFTGLRTNYGPPPVKT